MESKKRQLSKEEKERVIEQQKGIDGVLRCFISGKIIDLEKDKVEFDHLEPYSLGGQTNISNERVFLKDYNREKGKMLLSEYKDYFALKRFYETKSNKVKLQDIYEYLGLAIENTAGKIERNKIIIEGATEKEQFVLLSDPKLKIEYCYANVPINWILNDDEEGLQPRVIDFKRLWMLKQHLFIYPQLAPSIARFLKNKIRLFDGQHKLAAQLLNGVSRVDVKIYIAPDDEEKSKKVYELLLKTNLEAHSKLKQVPFYTNTLFQKWNEMYALKWEEYLEIQPNAPHSESTFFEYLVGIEGKPEASKMFNATITKNAHDNSFLKKFTSEANKDSKMALSQDLLKKSIFKACLYQKPSQATVDSTLDFRGAEIDNFEILTEIIAKKGYLEDWTFSKKNLTPHQKKVRRIWMKGSVITWSTLINTMINATFQLFDSDSQEKNLYRTKMSDAQKKNFETFFERLFNHPFWDQNDPTIDKALSASTSVKDIFENAGLNSNYILTGK